MKQSCLYGQTIRVFGSDAHGPDRMRIFVRSDHISILKRSRTIWTINVFGPYGLNIQIFIKILNIIYKFISSTLHNNRKRSYEQLVLLE